MKIFSADLFVLPLPEGHRFPMSKYERLCRRVMEEGLIDPQDLRTPRAASDADIALVHDPEYAGRFIRGEMTRREMRRIGFPWSPELVERSRRSSGATIDACLAALDDGVSVNLAGGTHHAFADRGEGFCMLNDSSIAARVLQRDTWVRRILVLDCDVHQGNGTAAIHRDDPDVFTFSIHGANNYPFRKETSDLDIPLPDETPDEPYLDALTNGLRLAIDQGRPDLAIVLAGADPFVGDTLGRLPLTKEGLLERDTIVLEACRRAGLPVAITMAGGYAKEVSDTVAIHLETVRLASVMAR